MHSYASKIFNSITKLRHIIICKYFFFNIFNIVLSMLKLLTTKIYNIFLTTGLVNSYDNQYSNLLTTTDLFSVD